MSDKGKSDSNMVFRAALGCLVFAVLLSLISYLLGDKWLGGKPQMIVGVVAIMFFMIGGVCLYGGIVVNFAENSTPRNQPEDAHQRFYIVAGILGILSLGILFLGPFSYGINKWIFFALFALCCIFITMGIYSEGIRKKPAFGKLSIVKDPEKPQE